MSAVFFHACGDSGKFCPGVGSLNAGRRDRRIVGLLATVRNLDPCFNSAELKRLVPERLRCAAIAFLRRLLHALGSPLSLAHRERGSALRFGGRFIVDRRRSGSRKHSVSWTRRHVRYAGDGMISFLQQRWR